MTYGSLGKCPPCQRDIRPLLCLPSPGMLFGTGHSAPAHDMASDLHLSNIRPTSRPSATGADRELAPPVAGLAALGAAGVALSAAAAWIAATGAGSRAARVQRRGPCPGDRRAHGGGAVRRVPESGRSLRLAAAPRRSAVVADDACRVFGQRPLQHRPGLGLVCRAAAHLSGAGLSHRPAGQPGGPAARPRRRRARGAVRGIRAPRQLPRAEPVGHLRHRLPSQRLHAAELRARLRRSRAHAGAPGGKLAPLRRRCAAAASTLGERQQPDACGARAGARCGRRANACHGRVPDRA